MTATPNYIESIIFWDQLISHMCDAKMGRYKRIRSWEIIIKLQQN